MEEFKVPIKGEYEEKYQFYKELREHFYRYYKSPCYSDSYVIINGVLYQSFQGNICYLENKRKTFLMLEETYEYILIRVISNSKRTLTVLKKFLKKL